MIVTREEGQDEHCHQDASDHEPYWEDGRVAQDGPGDNQDGREDADRDLDCPLNVYVADHVVVNLLASSCALRAASRAGRRVLRHGGLAVAALGHFLDAGSRASLCLQRTAAGQHASDWLANPNGFRQKRSGLRSRYCSEAQGLARQSRVVLSETDRRETRCIGPRTTLGSTLSSLRCRVGNAFGIEFLHLRIFGEPFAEL